MWDATGHDSGRLNEAKRKVEAMKGKLAALPTGLGGLLG